MKFKVGTIVTGAIPKGTPPEGTRWVPVGPVHREKGIHQRHQLQRIITFEEDMEGMPTLGPGEVEQTNFLDLLRNERE